MVILFIIYLLFGVLSAYLMYYILMYNIFPKTLSIFLIVFFSLFGFFSFIALSICIMINKDMIVELKKNRTKNLRKKIKRKFIKKIHKKGKIDLNEYLKFKILYKDLFKNYVLNETTNLKINNDIIICDDKVMNRKRKLNKINHDRNLYRRIFKR